MFFEAGAMVKGNIGEGRVVRAVSGREELGTKEGEMVRDREDEGFLVKMINGGGDVSTSNNP